MIAAFITICGKVSLLNIESLSAIDSPRAGIQKDVWEDIFRSCKSNLISMSSLLPMTLFAVLLWLSFSDSLTFFIVDGCSNICQRFFKLKPSVCTSYSLLPSCMIVHNGRPTELFFAFRDVSNCKCTSASNITGKFVFRSNDFIKLLFLLLW